VYDLNYLDSSNLIISDFKHGHLALVITNELKRKTLTSENNFTSFNAYGVPDLFE
jgi:hypothetical protein